MATGTSNEKVREHLKTLSEQMRLRYNVLEDRRAAEEAGNSVIPPGLPGETFGFKTTTRIDAPAIMKVDPKANAAMKQRLQNVLGVAKLLGVPEDKAREQFEREQAGQRPLDNTVPGFKGV